VNGNHKIAVCIFKYIVFQGHIMGVLHGRGGRMSVEKEERGGIGPRM
jgi:hypothetical protein